MRRFRVFSTPQIYWHVLKKRLKDNGNEIVTNVVDCLYRHIVFD